MQEKRDPLRVSSNQIVSPYQWQKSEETMKKVSSSFQYLESAAEIAFILSSLGCPTRRGTSLTSRLHVSFSKALPKVTHLPKT